MKILEKSVGPIPDRKLFLLERNSIIHLAALVHQMKGAPEKQYYIVNSDLA